MASRRNYTQEQMRNAIAAVRQGEKVSVAATTYCVPRITLRNKITGKTPIDCNLGPASVLGEENEAILVKWIEYMSENHFPVNRDHLLDSVQKLILEKQIENPFTNNRPGKKWLKSFIDQRHPEIAEKMAQNLSKAREEVTEEDLRSWFLTTEEYLKQKGLKDVLDDSRRVFNSDETAFFLQPKAGKVLTTKRDANVYSASGDDKENITVLFTANAAAEIAPPMVVFAYERPPVHIISSVPQDWAVGKSESGWMCAKTFYEYMTNVFNPWLEKENIPKPVLFFVDGHRSHMTLHLAEFCSDNGIEIIALYPNSTHLIQPMDVAVFRPLKVFWKKQVAKWKTENLGKKMRKEHFAPNLQAAVKQIAGDTIKNGFRKSGLFPFGPDYVDMTKISARNRIPPSMEEREETVSARTCEFVKRLESEIKDIFSSEKLDLYNRLYYMPRDELENSLPNEDQSLYFLWAKNKNIVTHTITSDGQIEPVAGRSEDPPVMEPVTGRVEDPPVMEPVTGRGEDPPVMAPATGRVEDPPVMEPVTGRGEDPPVMEPVTGRVEDPPVMEPVTGRGEDPPVMEPVTGRVEDPPVMEPVTGRVEDPPVMEPVTGRGEDPPVMEPVTGRVEDPPVMEPVTGRGEDPPVMEPVAGRGKDPPVMGPVAGRGEDPPVMEPVAGCSKDPLIITPIQAKTPEKRKNTETDRDQIRNENWENSGAPNVPSPFKRALFWPEPEPKKKRNKERLPSAITSQAWMEYMRKKAEEKKFKEEIKEKRMKERREKAILKQKLEEEKKKKKKITKKKKSKKVPIPSSSSEDSDDDVQYEDSEYDMEDDLNMEANESDEENIPLKNLKVNMVTKEQFVIIKYEGEYFPGQIKNKEGNQFEISTMTLSKGNSFRWPETPDIIWYNMSSIVEIIKKPELINKRGFFKVPEMEKYLPFLSL